MAGRPCHLPHSGQCPFLASSRLIARGSLPIRLGENGLRKASHTPDASTADIAPPPRLTGTHPAALSTAQAGLVPEVGAALSAPAPGERPGERCTDQYPGTEQTCPHDESTDLGGHGRQLPQS